MERMLALMERTIDGGAQFAQVAAKMDEVLQKLADLSGRMGAIEVAVQRLTTIAGSTNTAVQYVARAERRLDRSRSPPPRPQAITRPPPPIRPAPYY